MIPAELRASLTRLSTRPRPGFWARLFGKDPERDLWLAWHEQLLQALESADAEASRQGAVMHALNGTLVEHEKRTLESAAAIARLQESLAEWERLRQPIRVLGAQVGALVAHAAAAQVEIGRLARAATESDEHFAAHHREAQETREALRTLTAETLAATSGQRQQLQELDNGLQALLSETRGNNGALHDQLRILHEKIHSMEVQTVDRNTHTEQRLHQLQESQGQAAHGISELSAGREQLKQEFQNSIETAKALATRTEVTLAQFATQLGRIGATLDLDVEQLRHAQQSLLTRLNLPLPLPLPGASEPSSQEFKTIEATLERHERSLNKLLIERGPDNPELFARFYLAFENQFRGTQEEIAAKTAPYLPAIREAIATGAATSKTWLDLGCGRGELLDQLKGLGLNAVGVDNNLAMLEVCRSRGLNVVDADALQYLQSVPPGTLLGISAYHLIEHLPYRTLLALIDAAARALQPGGCLLLETPNPQNVSVGACNFYMDLTHQKPIPPMTAEFIVRNAGFRRVDVLRLHPYERHAERDSLPTVTDREYCEMFYGPRDYGIVAFK